MKFLNKIFSALYIVIAGNLLWYIVRLISFVQAQRSQPPLVIAQSSISGNDATGMLLSQNGSYTMRVYLMGNDRDIDQTVRFSLLTSIL